MLELPGICPFEFQKALLTLKVVADLNLISTRVNLLFRLIKTSIVMFLIKN